MPVVTEKSILFAKVIEIDYYLDTAARNAKAEINSYTGLPMQMNGIKWIESVFFAGIKKEFLKKYPDLKVVNQCSRLFYII
jgi:hypothetical protein